MSGKTKEPPIGPTVYALSDELVSEATKTINASIHELVFAAHHLEDDDSDSAQTCLTTVGMNLDRVQQMIIEAEKEIAALNKC